MATPNTYIIGQESEVCFNGQTLPCSMIQSIEVTPSQDITEVRSLCGLAYNKKKTPTVEVKIVLLNRNIELLGALFPQYYTAGPVAGDCGNIIISATSCSTGEGTTAPLNIHPICLTSSCNDITLWNADPKLDFGLVINEDDPESIEVTFTSLPAPALLSGGGANPNAGKIFQIGDNAGDGSQTFDCTVGNFV